MRKRKSKAPDPMLNLGKGIDLYMVLATPSILLRRHHPKDMQVAIRLGRNGPAPVRAVGRPPVSSLEFFNLRNRSRLFDRQTTFMRAFISLAGTDEARLFADGRLAFPSQAHTTVAISTGQMHGRNYNAGILNACWGGTDLRHHSRMIHGMQGTNVKETGHNNNRSTSGLGTSFWLDMLKEMSYS